MQLLVLEKRDKLKDSVGKKGSTQGSSRQDVRPVHRLGILIAVRAVECEQTKLDRVFKLLGYLYQHFLQVGDEKVKKVMLHGLEKRFSDYDQPALLIAYMLNPHRQAAFLNPACSFVSTRNAVQHVEILLLSWEAETQAQANGEAGVADQFIAYMNKESPFDESNCTTFLPYLCRVLSILACAGRLAWHLLNS
ncbi:hypothetical protein ABBQ38_008531 [Trebouxia sp. C0009 RCD-2024]